jgi:hypothetical protein
MAGCIYDTEACSRGGRISSGIRKRKLALTHWGIAGMRPGKIPAWWWNLAVKPDPRILFESEEGPTEDRRGQPIPVRWHMQNQERIHGLYRDRLWYPAFRRGISWYQYCRERENRSVGE